MSVAFYVFGITISSIGIILAIGFRVYIFKKLKRKYTSVDESFGKDYRIILEYKGEWEQNLFSKSAHDEIARIIRRRQKLGFQRESAWHFKKGTGLKNDYLYGNREVREKFPLDYSLE